MAEPAPVPGPDVRVVPVTPERWRAYRDVRLAALIDSPRAFWTTYAEAARRTDEEWRRFVEGATLWLALAGGRPVGTVGLYHGEDQPEEEVHLVGMWVASESRGDGTAAQLVRTAVARAREDGRSRVRLEVLRENRRAWDFYCRMGFRPTGETGTMPWDPTAVEEAMLLTDLSVS